jgi:hypothetical protein
VAPRRSPSGACAPWNGVFATPIDGRSSSTPRCEASPIRRGCAIPWAVADQDVRDDGQPLVRLDQQRRLAEGEQARGVREDRAPDGDRRIDPG